MNTIEAAFSASKISFFGSNSPELRHFVFS